MKRLSFKNFSVLGLVLMGVSAITAAMIPSNNTVAKGEAADGVSFPSTGGGETTVIAGGGVRSYTVTGDPFVENDQESATSVAGNGGTLTTEVGNSTAGGTTITALE